MPTFTNAFLAAIDHVMMYEVGGFWDVHAPAVAQGLIDTPDHRRQVGYTNDPDDHGGETKFGVSKPMNPDIDVTHLNWVGTQTVYYNRYWLAGKCDQMLPRVSVLHFDGCTNNGVGKSAIFLQRAIGVTPDGSIGPATLAKLRSLPDIQVCNKICDLRAQYYRDIVSNNPSQAKYLGGWLRRVEEMRSFVTNPSNTFN